MSRLSPTETFRAVRANKSSGLRVILVPSDSSSKQGTMVVRRVPQRGLTDCAICSVAAVLGYSYERVQEARRERYGHFDDQTAWWEHYLKDEGRSCRYLPMTALDTIPSNGGAVVGLLVMHQHRLRASHIVAIDELGFVDPSDGFPDHVSFDRYPFVKSAQGFTFDEEFLAVSDATRMPEGWSDS